MKNIQFGNKNFECRDQENVLDAFFRNKIDVPFSCRSGTCQACLIQAINGSIPKESQAGLSKHLIDSNHFLPCRCYPITNMDLQSPNIEDIYTNTKITELNKLARNTMALTLETEEPVTPYKTGQFINLKTHLDNSIRSYSITNSYNKKNITIHVQHINNGVFSSWVFNNANIGDSIKVHYPLGACASSSDNTCDGKLILATGSGLGAAYAIANESLIAGYENPVNLYHSSKNESGLYYHTELRHLAKKFQNFKFQACVNQEKSNAFPLAILDELAFKNTSSLSNWEVYLYGNPAMVKSATLKANDLGCDADKIYSDAFEYGKQAQYNKSDIETNKMEFVEEKKRYFAADSSMWNALGNGTMLKDILEDFYTKVLSDSLLAPFFKGVTKGHIVGKQYAFLNQIFTGKDCYFGDRPRNAHHWMIISDSLFDHREKLFADSCIKCGLKEPSLSQLLAFDESYRDTIVKTRVWPRITDGEIKPIKGFEEMVLEVGSLCDGCEKELEPGDKIHYHDRTGEMFCQECKKK